MALTVTFPNVAELLRTYVTANLPDGTYVGITRPASLAGRNVVILRPNGGPQPGRTLRAENVAVTVLAPDDETATTLAETVVALLRGLEDVPDSAVSAVDMLSAPTPQIDDSLMPCRYFAVQLFVRGS